MDYIDWEYYSSLHAEVAETDFDKLNSKASAKLDVFTHMGAKNFIIAHDETTATEWQNEVVIRIKNTVCELLNKINQFETSSVGTGLASVSNDGYSESYKITTQSEKDLELRSLVIQGLSGTGLVGAL